MFFFEKEKYYCPVCDKTVESFLPLNKMYEENAKKTGYKYFGKAEMISLDKYHCPICMASDRERLYAHYLKSIIPVSRPFNLLHFAPEASLRGMIKNQFPDIEYITADLLAEDVDVKCDISCLKMFSDNSFDSFICSHVLEYVINDRKAISELFRILKPGRKAILVAPVLRIIDQSIENIPGVVTDEDRWRYYGQNDHVRIYSKRDYLSRLRDGGFTVQELDRNFFGSRLFSRLGLTKTSVLYVVEK